MQTLIHSTSSPHSTHQLNLPIFKLRGRRKGGQGAMPPKPWIKKLKLSCRITHIDALAVAMALSHMLVLQLPLITIKQLINIAALRHFRHMTIQKKCSASGGAISPYGPICPPPPISTPGSAPVQAVSFQSQQEAQLSQWDHATTSVS